MTAPDDHEAFVEMRRRGFAAMRCGLEDRRRKPDAAAVLANRACQLLALRDGSGDVLIGGARVTWASAQNDLTHALREILGDLTGRRWGTFSLGGPSGQRDGAGGR